MISELLAEELKICPPLITDNLEIAVPNYSLGKWIREQITIKNPAAVLSTDKKFITFLKLRLEFVAVGEFEFPNAEITDPLKVE